MLQSLCHTHLVLVPSTLLWERRPLAKVPPKKVTRRKPALRAPAPARARQQCVRAELFSVLQQFSNVLSVLCLTQALAGSQGAALAAENPCTHITHPHLAPCTQAAAFRPAAGAPPEMRSTAQGRAGQPAGARLQAEAGRLRGAAGYHQRVSVEHARTHTHAHPYTPVQEETRVHRRALRCVCTPTRLMPECTRAVPGTQKRVRTHVLPATPPSTRLTLVSSNRRQLLLSASWLHHGYPTSTSNSTSSPPMAVDLLP